MLLIFDSSVLEGKRWYLITVWICVSLMMTDAEKLFVCFWSFVRYVFLGEMFVQGLCPFVNGLFGILVVVEF